MTMMHPIPGIQENDRQDGRLCFYRDPEGPVVEGFERLIGFIERAFGEDEDGDAVIECPAQVDQTAGPIFLISPIHHDYKHTIDPTEYGDSFQIMPTQRAKRLSDRFDRDGGI